jgi:succinyl-CoA synthetase beta subunit
VDLFEFQARDVFERHGVPVLRAGTATGPYAAGAIAEMLDVGVVVVKAQVKTGGRGKAGGVKLARSPQEAVDRARDILGMDIKGHTVRRVMVAEGADIDEEYYFSLLVDRGERSYLALCSREGGVEIEQLAEERPEALYRQTIDPLVGLDAAAAREIVQAAGFDAADHDQLVDVLVQLGKVFHDEDATLVEVNPLVRTGDGRIIALDGKVTLDENADFRHPEHEAYHEAAEGDPLEARAREKGLNYVKLDGSVGVIGNGAGLVMSTLDVVAYSGADLPGSPRPANFLDIGGGASAQVMADGLDIILSDEQVKSVFVNVFGGITACSEVARGIVHALEMLGDRATKPIVVRLDGNAVEQGRLILADANHPLVTVVDTMDDAARVAANLASASAAELASAR